MSQKDMTSFFTDAVRAAKNISRFSFSFVYLYYLYRSKNKPKRTMEQNPELVLAWQFIESTGTHLFLTGKAGTGKNYFFAQA